MSTENTLQKIREAQAIVDDAKDIEGLTLDQKKLLDKATVELNSLERTVIKQMTTDLVNRMTQDTADLNAIADEIKKSAKNLEEIGTKIGKAANAIGALVKIVAAAAGLG